MKRELSKSEYFTKSNKLAADLIRHDKRFETRRLTRSQALREAHRRIRAIYSVVDVFSIQELVYREREREEMERPEYDRVAEFYSRRAQWGGWTGD